MIESVRSEPWRVLRVLKRHGAFSDVIGYRIPKTHRVFGCQACEAVFTQPRSVLATIQRED